MKNVKTILIVLLVGALGYFAYTLSTGVKKVQMSAEALSDFSISDTASIDKLVINDTEGNPGVELYKENGTWRTKEHACIQQHLVETILETIKYIKVKSPVPKGAIDNISKSIAAHNKKMDIYQNGKLVKTWYIGDPTQDQYGTYMLLKDPEKGKSPEPFIMHLPNMYGNLSTRFITNSKDLECTGIFNYNPINIASVNVEIPDSTHLNYKVVAKDDNLFEVYNNDEQLTDFDTTQVRQYLLYFKKVHFERHNFILNETEVDSMLNSSPHYTIDVTMKDGETNNIRLFRRKAAIDRYGLDGKLLPYDQDRLWVELNNGIVVSAQYHVFNKLMRDINFFKEFTY